ncbi:MAG: hypothetical protein NWR72_05190 [Bacteroidia bacterium]|nr:hypothetical protein [Bacteroidia bacterium]
MQSVGILYRHIVAESNPEDTWSALFPDAPIPEKPLSHASFRRLENHLTHYFEEFISIQAFRKDQTSRDLYLIRGLNDRKSPELFHAELNKVHRRIESQPVRDAFYHRVKFELLNEEKAHAIRHQRSSRLIETYHDQFDLFWLHEKLRMLLVAWGESGFHAYTLPSYELKDLLAQVESRLEKEDSPLLDIYAHMIRLYQGIEDIPGLLKLFKDNSHLAGLEERKNMFIYLSNHLIKAHNQAESGSASSLLFEVYIWGIQQKLVFFGGYIPSKMFSNIVATGLHTEAFEEVLALIHDYIAFVPPQEREETLRYNLGNYAFAIRAIPEAFHYFKEKFGHISYEVTARTKVICLRYEQGERTELESPLRSLKFFIMRHDELSTSFQQSSVLKIRLMEKLVRSTSSEDLQDLWAALQEIPNSFFQKWLRLKVLEINPCLSANEPTKQDVA